MAAPSWWPAAPHSTSAYSAPIRWAPRSDEIVAGKAITGRQVAAKRIIDLNESADCRILFVSSSEDARVAEILKALEGTRMLTVGRGADFTRRGGMIGFTSDERRVRFMVNLAAADAAKLMLSSQLLRVAVRVER